MSEITYKDIQKVWENETASDDLQDLDDLRLRKMIDYLSGIRLQLAESEDGLQSALLIQEGQNVEFMLRDLLMIRRDKIIGLVLESRRPQAIMSLPEEDLFNRLTRGINGHLEFVNDSISGIQPTKASKKESVSEDQLDETDEIEYVTVRFLESTDIPAEGLDGLTYGPYKREDVARIPSSTALVWINQRIAVKITAEDRGE